MQKLIRYIIGKFSDNAQTVLAIISFLYQKKRSSLKSSEEEWVMLDNLINDGDWVLDVGANIGRYTLRMSDLVGESGQVISFEPMKKSFTILSCLVYFSKAKNVSLFNVAISNKTSFIEMKEDFSEVHTPYLFHTNTASAQVFDDNPDNLKCIAISIDDLNIKHPISLVKVDVEGSELDVCIGMQQLLKKDKPLLIIEDNSSEVIEFVTSLGYKSKKTSQNSRNVIFYYD